MPILNGNKLRGRRDRFKYVKGKMPRLRGQVIVRGKVRPDI